MLLSTRLFRSDTANRRSTTSGPGICRRCFGIFGELKLSRSSALSPRSCVIDVIVFQFNWQLSSRTQASAESGHIFDNAAWTANEGQTYPQVLPAAKPNTALGATTRS